MAAAAAVAALEAAAETESVAEEDAVVAAVQLGLFCQVRVVSNVHNHAPV